jgi:hypothetical protein
MMRIRTLKKSSQDALVHVGRGHPFSKKVIGFRTDPPQFSHTTSQTIPKSTQPPFETMLSITEHALDLHRESPYEAILHLFERRSREIFEETIATMPPTRPSVRI